MDPTADSTSKPDSKEEASCPDQNSNGFALWGWNLIARNAAYEEMPEDLAELITLDAIKKAACTIKSMGFTHKTPLINGQFILTQNKKTSSGIMKSSGMKLENLQSSGSFKIRGASYQFSKIKKNKDLVTMSAGNYGTAFAFLARELKIAHKAIVYMPKNINMARQERIKAYGVKVDAQYPQNQLADIMTRSQKCGDIFLHPFDGADLLIGHASAGLEILEQAPSVDIILVCCGGGGFLAGVTAAIRLSGNSHTKVYGVEYEKASTMFDSLENDEIVRLKNNVTGTICPGLSAPFPGTVPFKVFRALGDGVILVSEDEIKRAVKVLYNAGLVVEPSGAAAVASVLSNKVPYMAGKEVVAIVTGGNVSPLELDAIF